MGRLTTTEVFTCSKVINSNAFKRKNPWTDSFRKSSRLRAFGTPRYLSPVSTVSARNAWDHIWGPPTQKRKRLHCLSLAAKASETKNVRISFQGRSTLGDKLLKTRHGDKSQRQIVSRVLQNFAKIFVSATIFSRCNESYKIKSDWIRATCCGDKDSHEKSPDFLNTHEPNCRCNVSRNLLQQLIARPVHTEWFVSAKCTCCSDMSLSVYRPL